MIRMSTEKSLIMQVLMWIVCLNISFVWNTRGTQAAMYRHTGLCIHKGNLFEAGQTFCRGCDKCYCFNGGYICFLPTKPTTWPRKCQRVTTECGYRVVYHRNSALECHAYSWI